MNLHVTLIQSDLIWEDIQANLLSIEQQLNQISSETDVIILPEMFSTAFTNNAVKLAVKMDDHPVKWMQEKAKHHQALLIGSMIIEDEGKFFNRLLAVFPDGKVQHYDKRHLFSLMREHEYYSAGTNRLLIEYKSWKILPFVCYDLRFPVWCRNVEMADLMIFVANWPEKRAEHWNTLLKARAIENQCFVAAVNRVGSDFYGNEYAGDSAVYNFWGKEIISAKKLPQVLTTALSKEDLNQHRGKYTFWKDRDDFNIQ